MAQHCECREVLHLAECQQKSVTIYKLNPQILSQYFFAHTRTAIKSQYYFVIARFLVFIIRQSVHLKVLAASQSIHLPPA